MAYIGKKPEDKFRGLASYDTFTGDGSTTAFDVTNILPDGGTYDVEVFVDNVRQEGGAGKSYTIGNDGNGDLKRITFAVAPDNAAEIYVINPGRPTQINTVSDNAITAAKLQTDAVTTAKIQDDAVTSAKIADGTIVSSNIAPGTIANDRLANTGITINGTSIALGASGEIVAGTDWQAVTVADGSTQLTAEAGKGYFLDTNTGVIEVYLPSSPTRGDTIILMDYAGTFATNNVLVNTGTTNLDSTTTGIYKLETNDTIAEFVYVDSAKGWVTRINTTTGTTPAGALVQGQIGVSPSYTVATGGTITESGDYKIHSFTGDGCFEVTVAGNSPLFPCNPLAGPSVVDYLVVAGGGGGGQNAGGGGGAGGFRESSGAASGCYTASPLGACVPGITVSTTTYPVTVGGGGAVPIACNSNCRSGSPSIFATIVSTGGGHGGERGTEGIPGGSGGGWGADSGHYDFSGTGNTPPVSPPQGQPGGGPTSPGPNPFPSGVCMGVGGGGATQAGSPWPGTRGQGSPGGNGATTNISGSPTAYGGGGGGSSSSITPTGSQPPNPGGTGGGGTGGNSSGGATAGSANTGGGGGGSGPQAPAPSEIGAGGKGIVIIRYKFQ